MCHIWHIPDHIWPVQRSLLFGFIMIKAQWIQSINKWQFSGFLDTLYPDKLFIHHNSSMRQNRKQALPRLWSCDRALLVVIKQKVAAAFVWSHSEVEAGWDIATEQKHSPALPSCKRVPALQRTSAEGTEEKQAELNSVLYYAKLCRCNPPILDMCILYMRLSWIWGANMWECFGRNQTLLFGEKRCPRSSL